MDLWECQPRVVEHTFDLIVCPLRRVVVVARVEMVLTDVAEEHVGVGAVEDFDEGVRTLPVREMPAMPAGPAEVAPIPLVGEVGQLAADDVVVVVGFENDGIDTSKPADDGRWGVAQVGYDGGGTAAMFHPEADRAAIDLGFSMRGVERADAKVADGVGQGEAFANAAPGCASSLPAKLPRGTAVDVDRNVESLVERPSGRVVIAVSVADQNPRELPRVDSQAIEPRFHEARGRAAIDEDGGPFGGDQGGVAGATAGQRAETQGNGVPLSGVNRIMGANSSRPTIQWSCPVSNSSAHIPFVDHHFQRYAEPEMRDRARTFFEEMDGRRSIRDFSSEPVPRELIEAAIRTASTAPSGAHRQPWRFVAVRNPETKRAIRIAAEREEWQSYEGGRMPPEWLEALAPLGTTWEKPFLETVPWIVVVFEEVYGVCDDGQTRKNYYVRESVGIACGLFIAALHHMGLATLTHTPSPMRFLSKILGRPENERPYILFPVGYPAERVRVPNLRRKSLDEVAIWDPKVAIPEGELTDGTPTDGPATGEWSKD